MRPADLANVLQDLPDARRNEVAAALDDERLADVLEELPEHDQVEILAALDRERAADVLEEMDPDDAADLLAELPKPEQEVLLDLMEPDEADAGARAAGLPAGHRGQRDDLRAGDPDAGRDRRRGAGPDPGAAAVARPSPRRSSWPGRRWPPRPAATWAWCTSSGCCASRRPTLLGGVVDNDIDPLQPDTAARRDHPADGDVQPGRACRWSTRTTGWSARSPSTTCWTTRCRATGATATRRRRRPRPSRGRTARWLSRAGERLDQPREPAPDPAAPVRPGGLRPVVGGRSPGSWARRSSSST